MKKRLYILLTAIVLFPVLLSFGCRTTVSLVSRLLPDNDWPKKKIMVMPATDLTGIPLGELIDTVSEGLSKSLRKTGFFNVYHQNKTKEFLLFKPGEPIDPELLREAKEIGMNAIIFETLNPVETKPVRSGIWPFRKRARRLAVSMNIDIVDVSRGTMILNKEVTENITLSNNETTEEKEKLINAETKRALNECLPDILKKAAIATSLSLNQEVWAGRIVSVNKKEIIIYAGRDAGLMPGIVFEVFSEGECITSFKGQTYHLPGPKVGEIKIISIKQRHSSAEPIGEGDFKPGQIIRVKD